MRGLIKFTFAGAMLCGAAAWAFPFPPFKTAPSYFRSAHADGSYYYCDGGYGPMIHIKFGEGGRAAIVSTGSGKIQMAYSYSLLIEDVYENGPWRLTLDPEANLIGPGEIRFGNCSVG